MKDFLVVGNLLDTFVNTSHSKNLVMADDNDCDDWDRNCITTTHDHDPNQNDDTPPFISGIYKGGYNTSSVFVEVQPGVTANIQIDFTVETIADTQYQEWKSFVESQLTQEQVQELSRQAQMKGHAQWLTTLWSFLCGVGNPLSFENQIRPFQIKHDIVLTEISKKFYSLQTTKINVTGNISATGISDQTVQAGVFIQTADITFRDGKNFKILSTDKPVGRRTDSFSQVGILYNMSPLTITQN
ncbi:hypothetical protein [Lysinibacillus sp. UBA5990]|uniref:hypothetical protein n=1 Tax=Lysinibacillus sp. UBA5990 TaxID=1946773 RepID=UPI0025C3591E|nr:hypothetical protein [Lysinibacillus sp. UBA5990]